MTTLKNKNIMNLLITGGAGFIGSNFVKLCLEKQHNIIVLDILTYAGHMANLPENIEFIHGNICDENLVYELLQKHNIDILINFAAESHVDNSIHDADNFINTNILGVYSILNASLKYYKNNPNYKHIQVSTDEVYGSLEFDSPPFTEESPMLPNSPYSASKAAGDMLTRAWYHTYGLPIVITNCTNNYGAYQYPEKLIPHMIICALEGKPLPIYGDGKNIRDWIHVSDHCNGVYLAATKGKIGETYCFGGKEEHHNIDIVKKICSYIDDLKPRADGKSYSEQITFVKDRLGHDRRYAIDDTKAEKELGFTREYNFNDGLYQTVEWYLNNQDWVKNVYFKGTE